MKPDPQLETALQFADLAGARAIALQEHARAERCRRIVAAVLDAIGGSVDLGVDPLAYAGREILITFEATESGPVTNLRLGP